MQFGTKPHAADENKPPVADTPTTQQDMSQNSADSNQERLDEARDMNLQTDFTGKGVMYQGFGSDKSAAELGVDESNGNLPPHEQILAEDAASKIGAPQDSETIYSSHPIQNLRVGPFVFEGTVLRLKGDALSTFESLLPNLPLSERNNIKKIDAGRVDAIVQQRAATQGLDSTAGREALERLKKEHPSIGTTDVRDAAFATRPGQDGNDELVIPGTDDGDSVPADSQTDSNQDNNA